MWHKKFLADAALFLWGQPPKEKTKFILSTLLVLSMCGVGGVIYLARSSYAPLLIQLTAEQSISVTKILEQQSIDFRLTDQGRTLLVESGKMLKVMRILKRTGVLSSEVNHANRPINTHDLSRFSKSNIAALKSMERISSKHLWVVQDVQDQFSDSLRKIYGIGATQVHVYQDAVVNEAGINEWGKAAESSDQKKRREKKLIATVLFDLRLVDKFAHRQLLEKRELHALKELDWTEQEEKIQIQLQIDRSIRTLGKNILEKYEGEWPCEVMIAFEQLHEDDLQAGLEPVRALFPFGGIGLVLFILCLLLFKSGVAFMTISLSSL